MKTGLEISRITRDKVVMSFAWSPDGKLLAISHVNGHIAIVDVVDGFRTLGQTDLLHEFGMIRFSPDSRSLLCLHLTLETRESCTFCWNITKYLTCRVDVLRVPCVTCKFEAPSEGGFLLGDPLLSVLEGNFGEFDSYRRCYFLLNKHTLLRSDNDGVQMLNINKRHGSKKEVAHIVLQIVFSLSGETIYVVSIRDRVTMMVTAWNVSSGELIAEKKIGVLLSSFNCLLAVKGGVLITRGMGILQMWNFDLSKCVRCWTNITSVTDVVPISEETVACATKDRKVIILDTASNEILSTIQIDLSRFLLACNCKFQILTCDKNGYSLRLSNPKTTLWETRCHEIWFGRFSPAETFVISCCKPWSEAGIVVLDAVSGNTLHVLCGACPLWSVCDCEFVSDEECVVILKDIRLERWFVQLFNVKSGDLLSSETEN